MLFSNAAGTGSRAARRVALRTRPSPGRDMRVLSFDVGTRNFAICLVNTSPALRIEHWEVIDTVAETGTPAKGNIEQKKRALLTCLCSRRAALVSPLTAGDHVVIEQQPFGRGMGSPTMNILAHVIGTFFLLQHDAAAPSYTVRQVAARSKLAVRAPDWVGAAEPEPAAEPKPAAEPAAEPAPKRARRDRKGEYQRYKENKGKGVEICTQILTGRDDLADWKQVFFSSKKRDDMADAFLQALSQIPPGGSNH